MNPRIRELYEQACTRYSVYETLKPQDERKIIPDIFAELIVGECAKVSEDDITDGDACCTNTAYRISRQIKQHFGVEE
jgi:hypothetical protein